MRLVTGGLLLLDDLRALGTLEPADQPAPEAPGSVGVYLGGRWHRLTFDPATIDREDPIGSLVVSLLQERILTPILGVGDPRTDTRIEFVRDGSGRVTGARIWQGGVERKAVRVG